MRPATLTSCRGASNATVMPFLEIGRGRICGVWTGPDANEANESPPMVASDPGATPRDDAIFALFAIDRMTGFDSVATNENEISRSPISATTAWRSASPP